MRSFLVMLALVLASCGGDDEPELTPEDRALGLALAVWQGITTEQRDAMCGATDAQLDDVLSASPSADELDMPTAIEAFRALCDG
jgi:hypothetical protein